MPRTLLLGLLAACADPPAGERALPTPVLSLASEDPLTELAAEAVAAVPTWLQPDLALSLGELDSSTQDELAALLVDLDEPWLRDEIAFPIAHMDATILEERKFHPELLLENAQWIYARDADLAYVELTEVGEQGVDPDWYTTATYQVEEEDGTRVERTIDRDIYYWYLVHPRMEDEHPYYVDGWEECSRSECASTPEEGMIWREFLWEGALEGCPEDRECPVLKDYLTPDVDVLWKSKAYDRADNGAVGAIINWELSALSFGAGEERPIQPNRIYAVGCGNCGEWADMATAAARTALIPGHNVGAFANDHTWNEFWDDGWQQWEPVNSYVLHWTYYADANGDYYRTLDRLDNDCDGVTDEGTDGSDGDADGWTAAAGDCDDTRADVHPEATEDEANGLDDDCDRVADAGTDESDADADGWSIAAGDCDDTRADVNPGAADPQRSSNICFGITDGRGDSLVGTSRTSDYSKTATMRVQVLDQADRPVDGAVVTVVGNWSVYGYPDEGAWASEGATDAQGVAEIAIGVGNPYGFMVSSPAGSDPAGGYYYGDVIEDAVEGEVYEISSRVDGELPAKPAITESDLVGGAAADVHLEAELVLDGGRVAVDGTYDGVGRMEVEEVHLDQFVVDADNYALFLEGSAFEAMALQQDSSGGLAEADLPLDRTWYLVVANRDYASTTVLGSLEVEVGALAGSGLGDSVASWPIRLGPGKHLALALDLD